MTGLVSTNPNSHKLDLDRFGCSYFEVQFSALNGEADPRLAEHLADGLATGSYSRRGNRFAALVVGLDDQDPPVYRGSWFALPAEGPAPAQIGDPWAALGLLFGAADHADMRCAFQATSEHEPKLALPLDLFAHGAFPFNELRGYRVARIEGDRTVWTAIVDHLDGPRAFSVSVHFDDYDLGSVESARDLLAMCVDVRDDLMQEAPGG